MGKKRPGVMLYHTITPAVNMMTNEDAGILFKTILNYSSEGTEPDLPDHLKIIWSFIQSLIDEDIQRYEAIVEKRKKAIETRWKEKDDTKKDEVVRKNTNVYNRIHMYTSDTNTLQYKSLQDSTIQDNTSILSNDRIGEMDGIDDFFKNNFRNIRLTQRNIAELERIVASGMSVELILYAKDIAEERGIHNWGYIRQILYGYAEKGIWTVEDAKASQQRKEKIPEKKMIHSDIYVPKDVLEELKRKEEENEENTP